MDNLLIALPEIWLLSATCAVLVIGLFVGRDSQLVYWLSQGSLVITLVMLLAQVGEPASTAFNSAFGMNAMSVNLKLWVLVVAVACLLYSRDYLAERKIPKGEYYVLALFATAGMMIMISGSHLLTLYLGLELLSLSLYAMVALNRDNAAAAEAAMKYFVLGALASGMLLYGMSMIYGATGSLDIAMVAEVLRGDIEGVTDPRSIGARFGLVFLIVGIAFKLGAVPFHMWIPDVYEGAPTSVVLFISTAPKLAAFAIIIRLLVDGLDTLNADWQQILSIMAALSMIIGNLVAIAQTNIKRMLAYSTISHVGFLLLGIIGASPEGYSAAMFYTITYAFTTLAVFGVLLAISREGFEAVHIDDLKGLARRNPLLAVVLMLAMFSLAGVPPTVGFYAKLSVLSTVIGTGHLWLAILGVAMSVVGAFYYLRIIKMVYFDEPEGDATDAVPTAVDVSAGLAVNGAAVLALGIFPGIIMSACIAAFA